MSVITFLYFRSTRFKMDFVIFERKKDMSHQFSSIYSFFYNLLAVIYDKKFLT